VRVSGLNCGILSKWDLRFPLWRLHCLYAVSALWHTAWECVIKDLTTRFSQPYCWRFSLFGDVALCWWPVFHNVSNDPLSQQLRVTTHRAWIFVMNPYSIHCIIWIFRTDFNVGSQPPSPNVVVHAGAGLVKDSAYKSYAPSSGLRWCGSNEYSTDLPSSHRAWWNKRSHGLHLPIDRRDTPPRHEALSCRGDVGGGWVGSRCGACLHLRYSYVRK
jgi:hypothetical protein